MNLNRNALPLIIGILAILPWIFLFFLFIQGNQQFVGPSETREMAAEVVVEGDPATNNSVRNLRRQVERLNEEIDYLEEENESLRARLRSGGEEGQPDIQELREELDRERQARMEALSEVESLRRVYNETLSEVVRMRTEQMETAPQAPAQQQQGSPREQEVVEPREAPPVEAEPAPPPARRSREGGGGWILPPGQ